MTPLLVKLTEGDATAVPNTYRITLAEPSGGTVAGGLGPHLRVLQGGTYVAAGSDGAVTSTVPAHISPTANVFAYITAIRAEDITFASGQVELSCTLSAQRIDALGNPQGASTPLAFKIRKPPIILIHGFNSHGDWSADFKNALHATRFSDFVYELHYGIDPITGDIRENTYGNLIPLAILLDQNLRFQVEGSSPNVPPPWGADAWALTRYDVVAHSQGGVLTRMLCTRTLPWGATQTPFRGPENSYRGRFRRVVTIGSPQNGTSLLHYLLLMRANEVGFWAGGLLPIFQGNLFQAKFDPWGSQIGKINRSGCEIDPAAKFHSIRGQVAGSPPAFGMLGLRERFEAPGPNSGKTGQQIVLPSGSDTIVDMESQRVSANTPGSLFLYDIAHAPVNVLGIELFGTSDGETTYDLLGTYVGFRLDAPFIPGDLQNFGSFELPTPASTAWRDEINAFVQYLLQVMEDDPSLVVLDPTPGPRSLSFKFVMNPVTFGEPVPGSVNWFVGVFGPHGVTTDGLTMQVSTNDQTRVSVIVDDSVIGDVVLYCSYTSTNGALVFGAPVVVVSRPAGLVVTGIALVPGQAALAVGDEIVPEIWAHYDNGTNSLIYFAPGVGPQLTSSAPAVVSVGQGMVLRAQSAGVSTITAVYNGHTNNATLTVSPELHFVETQTSPASAGIISGGRYYPAGTNATVTAMANASYSFVNWTEAGTVVSTASNYTFAVTGDRMLIAQFAPNIPILGFGSPIWQTGFLNLTLQGPVGSNYEVQGSTDLSSWLPLTNFVSTGSPIHFQVPAATNFNHRFYRALLQ